MANALNRPFKPLTLSKARPIVTVSNPSTQSSPYKKRKISGEIIPASNSSGSSPPPAESNPTSSRGPLSGVENPPSQGLVDDRAKDERYFSVLWRNPTQKKHKIWDGDGVLSVRGDIARLQDVSGKNLGSSRCVDSNTFEEGSFMKIGGKDVEVASIVSREDYLAGRPFADGVYKPSQVSAAAAKPYQMPDHVKSTAVQKKAYVAIPKTTAFKQAYKNPLLASTVLTKVDGDSPTPRHDPTAKGALVMRRPKGVPRGRKLVDVVVDPYLCDKLRPHQREGVSFMYECVMGMRDSGEGAILADEMGLGKTLQTITLLWTLLKQNPVYGESGVIKKALIVCPVTLIKNWKKEFKKWLGNERIGVLIADGAKINLRDFTMGKSYSVMIIGYERLRLVQEELQKGAGVDIIIADEGHRLKTAKNKSAQAILSLNTDKRIVLSGTPIQNDLSEFHVMVDFVNPGILPKYNTFKRTFEVPITKSRQPDALKKDVELGQARAEELARLTKVFILRRTAEVLTKYLPAKTETVLFCRPTQPQIQIYQAVLGSNLYSSVLGSPEASFQLITALKKACNSPTLLKNRLGKDCDSKVDAIFSRVPIELVQGSPSHSSGKLLVLNRLLTFLRRETEEKVVVVSNYTSTLDILQSHLESNSWRFLRLDGSTPSAKRQELVDTFNRTPPSKHFAFLLSAKAGGVGLNLIGASRLVLFDVDWNPTTDLQAMARIHRDGQKRPVKIYRLLTAGGLDEKIYQRQLTKQGLADEVMDSKASASSFTKDELRDLFRLDTSSLCQTHDLLGCTCGGNGLPIISDEAKTSLANEAKKHDEDLVPVAQLIPVSELDMEAQEKAIKDNRRKQKSMQTLMQFNHLDPAQLPSRDKNADLANSDVIDDEVLLKVLAEAGNRVCFLFSKTTS